MSCIVRAKLFALCTLFASAADAMTVVRLSSGAVNDVVTRYIWVLVIAMLAWAASSLPVLAEWGNGGGRRRLMIAQGMLQAVFFGFVAFWTSVGTGQSTTASYIAAAGAAYMGDRHFLSGRKGGRSRTNLPGENEERNEG